MDELRRPSNLPTPREISFYGLIATIVIFSTLLAGLSVWFSRATVEPTIVVSIGQLSDFPVLDENGQTQPYRVQLEDPVYVWVANIDGEIQVYSPFATMPWRTAHGALGCRYKWSTSAGRFEDPCSGSKYRLDGIIISGPATRDLDYYTVMVGASGEILIDTSQFTSGRCRELYTGPATQISYKVWDETPPECDQ